MADFALWYVFITILGWLAFPLCAAVFKRANDRGFSVAKVVGLLVWGYLLLAGQPEWITGQYHGRRAKRGIAGIARGDFTRAAHGHG